MSNMLFFGKIEVYLRIYRKENIYIKKRNYSINKYIHIYIYTALYIERQLSKYQKKEKKKESTGYMIAYVNI